MKTRDLVWVLLTLAVVLLSGCDRYDEELGHNSFWHDFTEATIGLSDFDGNGQVDERELAEYRRQWAKANGLKLYNERFYDADTGKYVPWKEVGRRAGLIQEVQYEQPK